MARKVRPPKIITLDTETIGFEGDLKRIAIYDGERVIDGYTFEDVLPAIEQIYDSGFMPHIYIHNLDFDARKIPIWEYGNVVWSRTKLIGNRYARITCKKYIIHDSFKLMPKSLASLSKDFELEHGKKDLWEDVQKAYPDQYTDHVDFLNRCDPDDPIYVQYLHFDVISLFELLYKIMELSRIPEDKFILLLSTASMSKYIMKNGYGDTQFKSDGRDKTDYEIMTSCKAWSSEKLMKMSDVSYSQVEQMMRYGFYGGRTEVFTPYCAADNGNVVAWHYDVNSLYPSVMSLLKKLGENPVDVGLYFPVGYPEYETEHIIIENNFNNWMDFHRGLGFICADVFIPQQNIPPLPVKMGKLTFVCGHVSGCWTYNELEYAIKNCGVTVSKYHYQIHFKKTHEVFYNFVGTFYKMKNDGKAQGNESLTSFAKLILNTAYGWSVLRKDDKTALRDIKDIEKYRDTDKIIAVSEELGCIEIWDTVFSESIQVQVGAYVTSYARLVLLDALRQMDKVSTIYYCDTDSIVCSAPMPESMVDKYQLGMWDLEGEITGGAFFLQPKVYTEYRKNKTVVKFKGISKKRQKELTFDYYQELYSMLEKGEAIKYRVETGAERLPSLRVAQKRGNDPNKLQVIDKQINLGAKQKRDTDYKNNTTKPYFFASLEEFNTFSFAEFQNPPNGKNLFGG